MTTYGPRWEAGSCRGDGRDTDGLVIEARVPAPGIVLLSLTGELDMCSSYPLMDAVAGAISRHPQLIAVDLSGLTFIDAAGIGVLAGGTPHLQVMGVGLAVIYPFDGHVARMLRLAEVDHALRVFATADEALSHFAESPRVTMARHPQSGAVLLAAPTAP
jgi:anti-sigma B factor antagonist